MAPWLINALLLLFGIVLNVGAQALLKHAVQARAIGIAELFSSLPALFLTWPVLLGLVLYAASVANWLVVLSRLPLSYAYPAMSLGYVLSFALGVWLFHEEWSARQVIGLAVIIVGVALITPAPRPVL